MNRLSFCPVGFEFPVLSPGSLSSRLVKNKEQEVQGKLEIIRLEIIMTVAK